jgi:hypothetical protein
MNSISSVIAHHTFLWNSPKAAIAVLPSNAQPLMAERLHRTGRTFVNAGIRQMQLPTPAHRKAMQFSYAMRPSLS